MGLFRLKTISLHDTCWFRDLFRSASKAGLADVLCKWELFRSLPVAKGKTIMQWQQLSAEERAIKVQKASDYNIVKLKVRGIWVARSKD